MLEAIYLSMYLSTSSFLRNLQKTERLLRFVGFARVDEETRSNDPTEAIFDTEPPAEVWAQARFRQASNGRLSCTFLDIAPHEKLSSMRPGRFLQAVFPRGL